MPRTLSATQITTYLMCPRKYGFRYVEHLPPEFTASALSFGSAIHSALEWFHLEKLEGRAPDPEEVVKIFRADWDAEQEKPIRWKEGEDANTLREKGEALVRAYVEKFHDVAVQSAELRFDVPIIDPETGEVFEETLTGYFDLVLEGDTLCEIKTAARRFDEDTLRRHVQISAYAYAYRARYGRDPKIAVVQLLKTKKPAIEIASTERTKADDAFFVHLASEVAKGIDAGAFPPSPGWACDGCEFATACASWRGTVPVRQTDEDSNTGDASIAAEEEAA